MTGAGGFIGSHLVEALVNHGANVRAFVHYNSRDDLGLLTFLPQHDLERVDVFPGDLRDSAAVCEAVRGWDVVFHLGASISIPHSYRRPYEVAETNLMGTLNVLQACRESRVSRLVHTSSSEVYGTAIEVPIGESHPLQGQSPYSASKIGADKLAESFWCAYELPVVTIRPFNTYGPRQSPRAIIPTIITQALTQNTIRLGNLDARRDLTYVSDTVDGFLRVGLVEGVCGETFNLGTGDDVSVRDLAAMVVKLLDKEIELELDADRLRPERSEVQRLVSDYSRAKERIGWSPSVTIEEGLERTIAWFRDNLQSFQSDVYRM